MLDAGAALLGEAAADCEIGNGQVSCKGNSVSFGDIVSRGKVERTFTEKELAALPVKKPDQRNLMGGDIKALDIPAKTDGSAVYGIDVEVDGMLYARPLVPPTRYGSVVISVDDSAAKKIQGYRGYQMLNDPSELLQGWAAVLADSWVGAMQAADAIKVSYKPGPTAKVSEQAIQAEGERLVNDAGEGMLFIDKGDTQSARRNADKTVSALYRTASNLHFALEPMNATAL